MTMKWGPSPRTSPRKTSQGTVGKCLGQCCWAAKPLSEIHWINVDCEGHIIGEEKLLRESCESPA